MKINYEANASDVRETAMMILFDIARSAECPEDKRIQACAILLNEARLMQMEEKLESAQKNLETLKPIVGNVLYPNFGNKGKSDPEPPKVAN